MQTNSTNTAKNIFVAINRIFTLLNHLAVLALLCSYLASEVTPEKFWYLAFFGILYPVFLIVNVCFVVFWLLQFKKRFLYSLIIILVGFQSLQRFIQYNNGAEVNSTIKKERLKVMSYNVRLFDLYNWTKNKETRNKIFDLLTEEAPQIICFQEFYTEDNERKFITLDTLKRFLKADNYQIEYTTNIKTQHWGIATFTSLPVINRGKILFETHNNNCCIYTDMLFGEDTIRVYNMHLQSINFKVEEYKFVQKIADEEPTEDEVKYSKGILRRLKRAYVKRAIQADLVAAHIRMCKYPVIVCGDFNDTPFSYAYETISEEMKDAFVESGSGIGSTYFNIFPGYRIDYILYSDEFVSKEYRTIKEKFSDHYPITTYLQLNK